MYAMILFPIEFSENGSNIEYSMQVSVDNFVSEFFRLTK